MEECFGGHTYGILEEPEVQVGIEVEFQLTGILTSQPELTRQVEVQRLTLRLIHLSADADGVFYPSLLEDGGIQGVGHIITPVFMGDECLQASLHIFVEALEQCYAEGVLHLQMLGLVLDAVATKDRIVPIEIIVGGRLVGLIDTLEVV